MPVTARMLIQIPAYPSSGELNRWRHDLLEVVDGDDFYDVPLAIVPFEDRDLVPINDGSTYLDLGTCLNYYGVGYERGDAAYFVRVAEWAEQTIPDARVWYGSEESEDRIEPFPAEYRAAFLEYDRRVGNQPYMLASQDLPRDERARLRAQFDQAYTETIGRFALAGAAGRAEVSVGPSAIQPQGSGGKTGSWLARVGSRMIELARSFWAREPRVQPAAETIRASQEPDPPTIV